MDPEPAEYLFYLVQFFFLNIGIAGLVISSLVLILLLMCSALISGSEIAFFSLSSTHIEQLKNETAKSSTVILELLENPAKLLATILIANNLINIAIVILSTYILNDVITAESMAGMSHWMSDLIGNVITADALEKGLSFLITVVAVTFLLVLFGEVAPKIYASFNNLRFSKFMAKPLSILNFLFGILSNRLVKWSDTLERRLTTNQSNTPTKEDLDHAIELTVNQYTNEEKEADILRGIINFSDLQVKQIMCPRTDIVGFAVEENYEELLKMIRDNGFSRIPIYEESLDKIVGLLYAKDLIQHLSEDKDYKWSELIRDKLIFAPETKKVNELLKEFQEERVHMAIVVDEYGGVSGLVTLEDVMEEVIGEIKDEFDDEEELDYVKIDDNNYIFEGKTSLTDVSRIVDIDAGIFDKAKGESESLAGMILEILGVIPKVDKEITIGKNVKLKVVAVNKKRIEKVTLTKINK